MPKTIKWMVDKRKELIESGEIKKLHVYLAAENSKGAPKSISTIPGVDCVNCSNCFAKCYDRLHDCNNYSTCYWRAVNSAIYQDDPERFEREVDSYCKTLDRMRWHVGGCVKSLEYWRMVIRIAINNAHCKFHIFTKNYDAVNNWIREQLEVAETLGGFDGEPRDLIPENINLRFSSWPGTPMPNPYNIRTSEVVFEDNFVVAKPNSAICSGNCTVCAIHGKDCFDKSIETVYLPLH